MIKILETLNNESYYYIEEMLLHYVESNNIIALNSAISLMSMLIAVGYEVAPEMQMLANKLARTVII